MAWATSLSPRPDMHTSTVDPDSAGASRTTQAMAWAGSKAQRMPSVRASSANASSTSASVTGGYSARPIEARYECSGPTPG